MKKAEEEERDVLPVALIFHSGLASSSAGIISDKKRPSKSTNLSFLRLEGRWVVDVFRRSVPCRNGRNPFWRVLDLVVLRDGHPWERISADVRDHTVELSVFWHVIRLLRLSSSPASPLLPEFARVRASALALFPSLSPPELSPVFRGTSKGNLLRNPRLRRLWERKHEIAILRTPCSEAFIDNQIPILSSFISPPPLLLLCSPLIPQGPSSTASSRNSRDAFVSVYFPDPTVRTIGPSRPHRPRPCVAGTGTRSLRYTTDARGKGIAGRIKALADRRVLVTRLRNQLGEESSRFSFVEAARTSLSARARGAAEGSVGARGNEKRGPVMNRGGKRSFHR